jgi:hypothetical protein
MTISINILETNVSPRNKAERHTVEILSDDIDSAIYISNKMSQLQGEVIDGKLVVENVSERGLKRGLSVAEKLNK